MLKFIYVAKNVCNDSCQGPNRNCIQESPSFNHSTKAYQILRHCPCAEGFHDLNQHCTSKS